MAVPPKLVGGSVEQCGPSRKPDQYSTVKRRRTTFFKGLFCELKFNSNSRAQEKLEDDWIFEQEVDASHVFLVSVEVLFRELWLLPTVQRQTH